MFFSLNFENVGECSKAQWAYVDQRIALYKSDLLLLLLLCRAFSRDKFNGSILIDSSTFSVMGQDICPTPCDSRFSCISLWFHFILRTRCMLVIRIDLLINLLTDCLFDKINSWPNYHVGLWWPPLTESQSRAWQATVSTLFWWQWTGEGDDNGQERLITTDRSGRTVALLVNPLFSLVRWPALDVRW